MLQLINCYTKACIFVNYFQRTGASSIHKYYGEIVSGLDTGFFSKG
jgi:hypothetical protein